MRPIKIAWMGDGGKFDQVFARGVEAYGKPHDIFVGLTTSGNSTNIIKAFERANAIADELVAYGKIFQQPERAHATVQLYRTFLLREAPRLNRYLDQRLVVPTRLVIGAQDGIGSPALLDGWQANADDMSVEVLEGIGHFIPEETPAAVAARVEEMFA